MIYQTAFNSGSQRNRSALTGCYIEPRGVAESGVGYSLAEEISDGDTRLSLDQTDRLKARPF